MRLSNFIEANLEAILLAWDSFARAVETPAPALGNKALRNHAEQILRAVAIDMRTPQTQHEQIQKSKGLAPAGDHETAAQTHAVLRLMDGFTLDQMVSEYRALRSSVLRLWLSSEAGNTDSQVEDMVRFNEAIDQALTESIGSYGRAVETTRKMVLGVLGHDLRSPLSAMLMGSDILHKSKHLPDRERDIVTQISSSVRRANRMVNDLLDLARCNLSTGIPVTRQLVDLNEICKAVIAEINAGRPDAVILYKEPKRLVGSFDPDRMAQAFSNLIGNAVRHGDLRHPIHVRLSESEHSVRFVVTNLGKPISPNELPNLFDPERRCSAFMEENNNARTGLGLGLFIAAQIVSSHGGVIHAKSSELEGTSFEMLLPSTQPASHHH
ncbi:sensor histidine kinase [Pseudomonas putida]|uniref:histidine kinase n=1 Tax=Pseudomonas putida TaxID=303 RepID=A0A6I6XW09_PSEPU|nr:HAMP domain-containing sensor histidine kinase [Pseudomonas putida]QHG65461.1 HAMP domain-containing histidine kinase [Pseudomonas putida]